MAGKKALPMTKRGVVAIESFNLKAPFDTSIAANSDNKPSLAVSTLAFSLVMFLLLVLNSFTQSNDYIGPDNDDVMRLIEIRDLLAGQGWFDMQQYRLGLDGGTLMHWSRIIDAPMAGLMIFFSWFTSGRQAEILAVSIWPLMLIVPFLWASGRGAFHLGGQRAMLVAQTLCAVFIYSVHRFHPGSIDHHNAQIALVALIIAMMLDPEKKTSSFIVAGIAASIALVIGAETTPLLAVLAVIIAAFWGIYGVDYRKAAMAFGFSYAACVSIAFVVFIPSSHYTTVTCDNFSISFASLSIVGGVLLGMSALLFSEKSSAYRVGSLMVSGALVAGLLLKIAPQCLQNPYASLDPLLITLWLNNVSEAQSFLSEMSIDPATMGAFYAMGIISTIICGYRIKQGNNVAAYSLLLVASLASFLLSCIQIRGFIFAITISIFPISAMIADLHKAYRADPANKKAALAFVLMALISTPATWGLAGTLLNEAAQATPVSGKAGIAIGQKSCRDAADMMQLAALDPGLVAGDSNIGAHVLRYTKDRVLSAPYHRNPGGMLTVLKIQLAQPDEAEKIMRAANVRYYVVCETNTASGTIAEREPTGFSAMLAKGQVPSYLEKLPSPVGSNLTVYALRPPSSAS